MMDPQRRQEPTLRSRRPAAAGKDALVAFLANPEAYDYQEVTVNLCGVYTDDSLSDQEREIAHDIMRQLASSMEIQVRQALADHLKSSEVLPHDIAFALAQDIETVALPILEYSEVLTESDLIQIVRSKGEAQQSAIARRETVPEAVSEAIVECGAEEPVLALLSNIGAAISEAAFSNVVQLYPQHEPIKVAMAERLDLPVTVAEKLVDLVSENLRFEIIARNASSAPLIDRLLKQGGENATIAMLSRYEYLREAEDLAGELVRRERLTATLLLRALYYGQLDFFEFGLARLAQVHVRDARREIHSGRPHAFQRLYRRAGMPAQLFLAFAEALSRLSEDIGELAPEVGEHATRRSVRSLLASRDFDREQFESALLLAGSD